MTEEREDEYNPRGMSSNMLRGMLTDWMYVEWRAPHN